MVDEFHSGQTGFAGFSFCAWHPSLNRCVCLGGDCGMGDCVADVLRRGACCHRPHEQLDGNRAVAVFGFGDARLAGVNSLGQFRLGHFVCTRKVLQTRHYDENCKRLFDWAAVYRASIQSEVVGSASFAVFVSATSFLVMER